jgi:hypothetical protein
MLPEWSPFMREKIIPYLSTIAEMERDDFLKYDLLLRGVFRSSPKGVPWSNDPDRLDAVCGVAAIYSIKEVEQFIKDKPFFHRMGGLEQVRYIQRELGWIPASRLDEELSRRETFWSLWNDPREKKPFKTLNGSGAKQRHEKVWSFIRETVAPSTEINRFLAPGGFKLLADLFKLQTWGFFIRKDDPAISAAFGNIGSMVIPLKGINQSYHRKVYEGLQAA